MIMVVQIVFHVKINVHSVKLIIVIVYNVVDLTEMLFLTVHAYKIIMMMEIYLIVNFVLKVNL